MGEVDEQGEQDFEEELLSNNKEAPNAKKDDAISSTITTPGETTLTKGDILEMNMK